MFNVGDKVKLTDKLWEENPGFVAAFNLTKTESFTVLDIRNGLTIVDWSHRKNDGHTLNLIHNRFTKAHFSLQEEYLFSL